MTKPNPLRRRAEGLASWLIMPVAAVLGWQAFLAVEVPPVLATAPLVVVVLVHVVALGLWVRMRALRRRRLAMGARRALTRAEFR